MGSPLWLDDEELLAAAELLEVAAATVKDDEEAATHISTATRLREVANAARASGDIGPRGWPVVRIEVQGTGPGLRRHG